MYSKRYVCRKAKVLGAKAIRYAKTHKLELLQLGVMAAIVLMPETSFAQTDKTTVLDEVSKPMTEVENFATGKFAKGAATLGLVAGGGSFMINSDNQIVKRSMQGAGAAGFLCSVPTIVDKVFGFIVP